MSKPSTWLPPFVAGLGARLGLVAAGCWAAGIGLGQCVLLHDGWEYLRLARAFAEFAPGEVAPETLRLMPGFPALIALTGLGHQPGLVGITIAIVCGAAAAPLTGLLGRDGRLAWWMVVLPPSWLLFTSVVMSEGLFVLTVLGTLLLLRAGRWAGAGLLAGVASTVRPMGILLFFPVLAEAVRRRPEANGSARALLAALVAGGPWVLGLWIVSAALWANPLRSAQAYAAQDLAWPLQSLIGETLNPEADLLRKGLVWSTLALTVAGGAALWRRWRRGDSDARPLVLWHWSLTLLCVLLPSRWVFGCLERFLLPVWPTTLIGLAPLLPRRRGVALALGLALSVLSWAVALSWIVNMARVFPFDARALP